MALRKVGRFNDIPDDVKIKPLAKGEVASYRYLFGYTDPISKKNFMGGPRTLPSFSQFIHDGKVVEVGMVGGVDAQGNPRRETITRKTLNMGEDAGRTRLDLSGNNAGDTTVYDFLETASFVKGNTIDKLGLRDETVEPILERIDWEGEAQTKLDAADQRRAAIAKAYALEGEDLRVHAIVRGIDVSEGRSDRQIKADVMEDAEANPEAFLESTAKKHTETMALLANARRLGIVDVDHEMQALAFTDRNGGNGVIVHTPNTGEVSVARAFLAYTATQDGQLVLDEIKKLVKSAESATKQKRPNG